MSGGETVQSDCFVETAPRFWTAVRPGVIVAELERAKTEIALLKEELSIKDAPLRSAQHGIGSHVEMPAIDLTSGTESDSKFRR